MSFSRMYVFRQDGLASNYAEYGNGWGSAPRVWNSLTEKYRSLMYPTATDKNDPGYFQAWEDLWNMEKDKSLPLTWWERNVERWTYDNAIVKGEDLALLFESFARFEQELPVPAKVNHLPQIMEHIAKLLKEDPRILGIGHYHTSVSDNPWNRYDGVTDIDEPYDLNQGTKHHFVELVTE